MKFYSYSVKEKLTAYWGTDAITAMRLPHESVRKDPADQEHLWELCWQYADERAIGLCLEERFLVDTILEDDYIAYIVQFQEKQYAYLMFMVTEDEPLFSMDTDYAKQIINEWSEKGYQTLILRECIGVDYYGNDKSRGFHLVTHSSPGHSSALYTLAQVNGKDLLIFDMESCWKHYYNKLLWVSRSQDIREYECLFEPDVSLTTGAEKSKTILDSGIQGIKKFFENNGPAELAYQEFRNTQTFTSEIIAGSKRLVIYVDRCNLISEINISDIGTAHIIVDEAALLTATSLLYAIPEVISIRMLDPVQMHGFAVQLTYAGNNVRNYYLHSFDTREIPEVCDIDGKAFSRTVFESAYIDDSGSLCFENGYSIPKHLLYYRSIRQLMIQHTGNVVYDQDGITIRSIYRLPLLQFMSHFSTKQYRGFPDECYGPKRAWLDDYGNRLTDIAYYSSETSDYRIGAAMLCVEPTAKYGFINPDGTWLVPPIYDSAERFQEGLAKATRTIDGVKKQFVITEEGKELPFDYPVDTESFTNGMVAFNAEEWQGEWPHAGYYFDEDYEIKPGKWGFINSEGKIVVEPQYVYAIGFWNGGGDHSIVAKMVEGKLLWGVIDLEGTEVIPCKYPGLYTRWGEAVAFQSEADGPFGLMDFSGRIIAEPQFGYIEAYDTEHRLITAGEHGDALGVYSVDLQRWLIEGEYDCVDYDDHIISCEVAWTCNERYFDYDGKELLFPEYDRVYEADGVLKVWKNGKSGAIDFDGTVLVPPVLENGMETNFKYYRKGLIVTGSKKIHGLSRVDGTVILPDKYTEIYLHGCFAIASERTDTNWCIRDSLFTTEGTLVLEGLLRSMHIDSKKHRINVETPNGLEFFEIVTEKCLEVE